MWRYEYGHTLKFESVPRLYDPTAINETPAGHQMFTLTLQKKKKVQLMHHLCMCGMMLYIILFVSSAGIVWKIKKLWAAGIVLLFWRDSLGATTQIKLS